MLKNIVVVGLSLVVTSLLMAEPNAPGGNFKVKLAKMVGKNSSSNCEKSKRYKMLELQLAKNIAIDSNTPKSQYEIVDAISKLRTELTKAHLECINNVRAVLTKEQYKKLLVYARNK